MSIQLCNSVKVQSTTMLLQAESTKYNNVIWLLTLSQSVAKLYCSSFLCYVCYMRHDWQNRIMTAVQGVGFLLYVSWVSIQCHTPAQVAYRNAISRL
jgi:hypothetical protein